MCFELTWVGKGGGSRVGGRRVGPRRVGPRRVGPRRVGLRRVGPRRVGSPKFRAFFDSPDTIFFFSSLSWVSSRGILVNPQMCTFGLSKTPAASGPPGLQRQPDNSKRAHLSAPVFKNTTKIQQKTPRGEEKNEFCGGRGKKKERNFGRSRGEGRSRGRAV